MNSSSWNNQTTRAPPFLPYGNPLLFNHPPPHFCINPTACHIVLMLILQWIRPRRFVLCAFEPNRHTHTHTNTCTGIWIVTPKPNLFKPKIIKNKTKNYFLERFLLLLRHCYVAVDLGYKSQLSQCKKKDKKCAKQTLNPRLILYYYNFVSDFNLRGSFLETFINTSHAPCKAKKERNWRVLDKLFSVFSLICD